MKDTLIEFYLDWVNNYLSITKMAEDNGISFEVTVNLIELGKNLHEEESRKSK
jgi:hypothetical protein